MVLIGCTSFLADNLIWIIHRFSLRLEVWLAYGCELLIQSIWKSTFSLRKLKPGSQEWICCFETLCYSTEEVYRDLVPDKYWVMHSRYVPVLPFFPHGATQPIVGVYFIALYRALTSSRTRLLDHTQRRATVGRNPVNEWSVRRRDLYLTTHNTHNRQTSMPRMGFEPTIAAGERP